MLFSDQVPINPNDQSTFISYYWKKSIRHAFSDNNTASKETNAQTKSQDKLHTSPTKPTPAIGKLIHKSKRPKDPVKVAAKLQIQNLAAARSLGCSVLIRPENFVVCI